MCSAFTPDWGFDNSTIFLIGDVYCPNKKCLGKLCLHKKTSQSLGRSDYQCPNARLCVKCGVFLLKVKQIAFSCRSVLEFTFLNSPKSIQDVIADVYCPGEYCLNREKCKSNGGYVKTPRSIYGCDNCAAWLFVHKVPFTLEEHVKTTKTDKTRVFFAKKDVTRQIIVSKIPISVNQL